MRLPGCQPTSPDPPHEDSMVLFRLRPISSPVHQFRLIAALLVFLAPVAAQSPLDSFRFVILGDRTGESQPGVYEHVLKAAAEENPAFIMTVGDTIEGPHDQTAESEWQEMVRVLSPYRRFPLYLAAGNHDIWSELSEQLFQKYAGHAPHYSFDYKHAHFTVLDNSRSEQFSAEEIAFLEKDLQTHAAQPVKFVVSHRPSWLMDVVLRDSHFPVHELAKKYGVRYVIAGHIHAMLCFDLEGVTYVSMVSSGGHLRASRRYEDGWFFGYSLVEIAGNEVRFQIKELASPHGQGRVSRLDKWGAAGAIPRRTAAGAR
jgi:3',5'-cyclic-AMP phosphodiesterase